MKFKFRKIGKEYSTILSRATVPDCVEFFSFEATSTFMVSGTSGFDWPNSKISSLVSLLESDLLEKLRATSHLL